MAKNKTDKLFWESRKYTNWTYQHYYNRLTELAISRYKWNNLPESIDERFLELVLFGDGMCVFFKDDVLGYLALRTTIGGILNVYQIPKYRRAYASNGFNVELNEENSVIIFNNLIHTNSLLDIEIFAERLYRIDRIIDVNVNAQKTPVLISCAENERLTLKNLYMKYDGDVPVIYADKGLNPNSLKVLKTDAPYLADKLYELKSVYWNEAMTFLGINNLDDKKERMVKDEVRGKISGSISSRYSGLEARRQACKQINEMFKLEKPISCDYRDEIGDSEFDDAIEQDDDTIEKEKNGGEGSNE